MHGVPDRAKSGLPVISQASFRAGANDRRLAIVTASFELTFRRVYSTGETKFDSTYGSQFKVATISVPIEVDLSMATYK